MWRNQARLNLSAFRVTTHSWRKKKRKIRVLQSQAEKGIHENSKGSHKKSGQAAEYERAAKEEKEARVLTTFMLHRVCLIFFAFNWIVVPQHVLKEIFSFFLSLFPDNVLNLDPNDSDGDTDIANGRFDANAEIIAKNMDCPDIVGLQEIQDNTGSDNGDGITSASETLQLLVDSIATVSANSCKYMFLDNIFIGEGTSGGQPGGNIRTAFLYDPTRVKYIEGSLNAVTDPIDQQTNSENPFFGGRLPLAAKFMHIETQTYFEVVNNHFSSKGGSAPIMGVEQPFDERQEDPNINGSLDERQAQSEAVRQYLLPKATAHENFIVMGDLNEFEFISPVEGLTVGTGLKNLADDVPSLERYSFIFQGNSQVLDHILVSEYFAEAGSYMKYVHVNSEFAETDERASDHDPVVAWIPLD